MNLNHLSDLFQRDLSRLQNEIMTYTDETHLWKSQEGISNTAGNLSLHIIGNLNHFVGATLANTGYVRDRDFEFNGKISRTSLLERVEETMTMLVKAFNEMNPEVLDETYPLQPPNFPEGMSTGWFLLHLYGHLNYHLGQINYHRRILD